MANVPRLPSIGTPGSAEAAGQARRDLLARVGVTLFGAEWVSPLARELGVALRTVQRWAAGDVPVPPGVLDRDLPALVRRLGPARLAELERSAGALRKLLEAASG